MFCLASQEVLRESGQVRILRLTTDPNEFCLVLTTDYIEHVGKPTENKTLAKTVIGTNQLSTSYRGLQTTFP